MILAVLLSLAVQDPPVVVVGTKPAKVRKICKRIAGTGSRMGAARDCRTAAQWRAAQVELDARDLNTMNNQKGFNAGQTSSPGPHN